MPAYIRFVKGRYTKARRFLFQLITLSVKWNFVKCQPCSPSRFEETKMAVFFFGWKLYVIFPKHQLGYSRNLSESVGICSGNNGTIILKL